MIQDGTCQYDSSQAKVKVKGDGSLGLLATWPNQRYATDQEIMSALQQYGPVTMDLNASGDDFMHYKSVLIVNKIYICFS